MNARNRRIHVAFGGLACAACSGSAAGPHALPVLCLPIAGLHATSYAEYAYATIRGAMDD
jgi:hypothetical protein